MSDESSNPSARPLPLTRRAALSLLGGAGAALTLGRTVQAQQATATTAAATAPIFSGPGPLESWNALGPLIALPQKAPLIRLVDRPPALRDAAPVLSDGHDAQRRLLCAGEPVAVSRRH